MSMDREIKIVIADDYPILRRGLISVIEATPNMKIVGEAENGEIACQIVEKELPDVIVLDIEMPVLDGIEAAKILSDKFPSVQIIFLTKHKSAELLNIFKKLNIKGYLIKDSAVLEIVNCIKQVVAGNFYLSPALSELLVVKTSVNDLPAQYSELSKLTLTEMRVLRHIAAGRTNREIAKDFFISTRTVENHRFNICRKLHIKGNHSLLKFVYENKDFILGWEKNK